MNPLAGEQLVEGHAVVQADAAAGNQRGGVQGGDMVPVGDQRVTPRAEGAESHFVIAEVGLLGDDGDAVRECPAHGIDGLDLLFPGDAPRSRECCQQRDIVEGVRVRLHRQCVGALELRFQRRGQRTASSRVDRLGPQDEEHRVPGL